MKQSIIIIIFCIFFFPDTLAAQEIKFSDAKIWDYQNIADFNFDSTALNSWDTYQIKTIDLGNDNQEELVVAAGLGSKPEVKLLSANGQLISNWLAYEDKMLNGVELEVADLNNDNKDEIITGVGDGAGAHIRIFNSAGETTLNNGWFAWDNENRGVKITAIQADNDDSLEIAAAIYKDKQVLIKIFDYDGSQIKDFVINYDLGEDFKITKIDLGGDNKNELLLANGQDREAKIYLYRTDGSLINNFLVYDDKFIGGVQIASIDINQDGKQEIITAPQLSGGPHIKIFDGFGEIQSEFMTDNQDRFAGLNFTKLNNKILFLPAHQTTGRTDLNRYIKIDISDQRLELYGYNGIKLAAFPVSTGTVQTPTPLGEYTIDYKEPNRFSRTYGLYMPYWMAFNVQKGYGIHELPYWPSGYKEGLNHLGQRVSHGCVRLGLGNAEWLYNKTPLGTKVFIEN